MSLPIEALEAKHPYWTANARFWDDIDLLYTGGYALKQQASRFLQPRPVEPGKVLAARLARFSYQSLLSTALGWYTARLFQEDPQFFFRHGSGAKIEDDFFARFLKDADRRGTPLTGLARDWFLSAVLFGSSWVLTDLDNAPLASSFREQKESGSLDPYLVTFDPRQVINWDEDAYGNLEWAVVRTQSQRRAFGENPRTIDRWYYFDREEFRIYEAVNQDGPIATSTVDTVAGAAAITGSSARNAIVVNQGRHSMAALKRVPLRRIAVPESLWLAYRVAPQIIDHLNVDNAYGWALTMSCLPVPVITGRYEEPPAISETAYIKLEQGSTFSWSEPAGTSYGHAADRVASLRQEIYRQMYLQSQARDQHATAAAQSGYSKAQDMAPSHQVLNEYGAILRAAISGILCDVAAIRQVQDFTVDCQGLTFEDKDQLVEITAAQAALDLQIPSDTWARYVQKRVVRQFASGADPDTLQAIDQEIDAAPGQAQRDAQQRQDRLSSFSSSLETALGRSAVKDAEAA